MGSPTKFHDDPGNLSELPTVVFDPLEVRRAVGAAWVWVRARDGRFGEARVLSEREMIAHDHALIAGKPPVAGVERSYGIRVGGVTATNTTGLHHPDVLMMFDTAGRGFICSLVRSARVCWRRG